MPRGDRTGPNGNGPMTGRGMGYCAGNDRPGYYENDQNYGRGFGGGFRRGGGRGFGGGGGFGFRGGNYNSNFIPNVSEKTLVENEIKILKDQLSALEKQLSETKKED
ncbi:MAG: DUF5320 domain-containing protein [Candidatus Cloacimonetes bacterium]|nr:DUF5320 domain-containing protein [Candidatus Cloacimonadota bacterium]